MNDVFGLQAAADYYLFVTLIIRAWKQNERMHREFNYVIVLQLA